MKIKEEQKARLEDLYQSFLHDERILRMKEISMHRGSNCYEHSFKVAKKAIKRALRHKEGSVNLEVIMLGAILHDYYLYDWRKDRAKLKKHGQNHPGIAIKNAIRDFNISEEVVNVIKSHMWPINIKTFPNTKEARIVSLADKAVTIGESLSSKNYKKKKRETYLLNISHLF